MTNRQESGKGEKENEKEKEKENQNETEDERLRREFAAFWELYPVKLGKDMAMDAWKRLKPDGQAVCDGVRKWRQTKQWQQNQGRFIPRAVKFLEEQHYDHLPEMVMPVGAVGGLGKAELEAIESVMGMQ